MHSQVCGYPEKGVVFVRNLTLVVSLQQSKPTASSFMCRPSRRADPAGEKNRQRDDLSRFFKILSQDNLDTDSISAHFVSSRYIESKSKADFRTICDSGVGDLRALKVGFGHCNRRRCNRGLACARDSTVTPTLLRRVVSGCD